MEIDFGLLKAFLVWVACGGGAGVVAFFMMDKVPALAGLEPEYRRYTAIALTAALAMGAYAGAVGLGYLAHPGGGQGWLEGLFAVAFVATGLNQIIHGRRYLRGAARRTPAH